MAQRISNLRKSSRAALEGLQTFGVVDFRISDGDLYRDDLAWLLSQKRRRLEREGKSSALLKLPITEEFFTATAAKEDINAGRAWISLLSVNRQPIAASLNLREGPTLYMLISAYDPSWRDYSPCRTLNILTLQHAFKEQIKRCYMTAVEESVRDRLATNEVRLSTCKAWLGSRRVQ